jgi:class 3 adenylate cyclase
MPKDLGILFADISGTTRLFRKIGTDEARHQLERCLKRMERAIESCKGQLVSPAVDEMLARFESADSAILAAVEMQRRIQDLPPLSGVRLSIRIGVHGGAVEESPKGLSGPGIDAGRALLNLAGAGQIVTSGTTAALLPRSLQENLYSIEHMALSLPGGGEDPVYQVGWQGEPVRASQPEVAGSVAPQPKIPAQLALRWDGRAFLVDAGTASMQVGRDRDCDLRLSGVKVSRKHARFECRPKGFFLVDDSSNGTYLYVEGVGERRIHNEEVALHGRGRIAFGHTTDKDDGEIVHFELS